MLGSLISARYGWARFEEFVNKNFRFEFNRELIDVVDPYLRIDASLALEGGLEDVAFQMVAHGIEKTYELREGIYHGDVEYMGIVPDQFRGLRGEYLEGERYDCGYQREWSRYVYTGDDGKIIEFTWHRHDGFGREAGTVEFWVDLIDKDAAPYI